MGQAPAPAVGNSSGLFGKENQGREEGLSEEEAAGQGVHVQPQLCFHLISQQKRAGKG